MDAEQGGVTPEDADAAANSFFAKQARDNAEKRIDISGLDKTVLLEALWKNSRPARFFNAMPSMAPKLDKEELHAALNPPKHDDKPWRNVIYVDYLCGRVIKCDFTGDKVSPAMYDRDNGDGAFRSVVDGLRRA